MKLEMVSRVTEMELGGIPHANGNGHGAGSGQPSFLGLEGKSVLVTGGVRPGGISESVVHNFCGAGAGVTFMDVDPRGEGAAEILRNGGLQCRFVPGDAREPADARRFVVTAVETFGPPHILVSVVGGSKETGGPSLMETDLEQLMGAYKQNVGAPFNVVQAALPYLVRQQGDKSVICIGSVNGGPGTGWLQEFAYSCAKEALTAFIRCSAAAYGKFGVRFNLVCPASVPNMNSPVWGERLHDPATLQRLTGEIYNTLGRLGTPQDVSNAVLYLASARSSWTTGHTLFVDGGLTSCGAVKVRSDGKWWLPVGEEEEEVLTPVAIDELFPLQELPLAA